MSKASSEDKTHDKGSRAPRKVRLPGFIVSEEIGLGDVVKKATSYVGMTSCGGCEQRAGLLNRWIVFTRGSR